MFAETAKDTLVKGTIQRSCRALYRSNGHFITCTKCRGFIQFVPVCFMSLYVHVKFDTQVMKHEDQLQNGHQKSLSAK